MDCRFTSRCAEDTAYQDLDITAPYVFVFDNENASEAFNIVDTEGDVALSLHDSHHLYVKENQSLSISFTMKFDLPKGECKGCPIRSSGWLLGRSFHCIYQ